MFNKILVVCVGNICRSPMAAGLLQDRLAKKNVQTTIDSAGIGALVDEPATQHSFDIMQEQGIDIASHRAKQLTQKIALAADLILVMEAGQKKHIEQLFPSVRGRVFLLGKWQKELEIPDPFKQPRTTFDYIYAMIEQNCSLWLEKIAK
jgi:protein-tyrosine phosphatase